jgi:hypothetical protein
LGQILAAQLFHWIERDRWLDVGAVGWHLFAYVGKRRRQVGRLSHLLPLLASVSAATDVAANLVDPGSESLYRLKPIEVTPGLEESLLDHIVNRGGGHAASSRQACQALPRSGKDAVLIGHERLAQSLSLTRYICHLSLLSLLSTLFYAVAPPSGSHDTRRLDPAA